MESTIESNLYPDFDIYKADFELMCRNAMVYNSEKTIYYKV